MRCRGANRAEHGLTLIEILVAITLLSLLSVGILTALQIGVTAWDRANSRMSLDRRIATANTILHAELESIFLTPVEFLQPPQNSVTIAMFFQGQPKSMRFVSAYSLANGPGGGLRVVEMQVANGPKGQRLLLNELPYEGPRSLGGFVTGQSPNPETGVPVLLFAPIQVRPSSFVLADELQDCTFTYFAPERANQPGRWMPDWRSSLELPAAISVDLVRPPDMTRLQPVRVTAVVRAVMRPM